MPARFYGGGGEQNKVGSTPDSALARSSAPYKLVRTVASGLWRVRFTALLALALAIAGWLTDSHIGPLSAGVLDKIGFAPRDLWEFEVWRILTSAFVTDGAGTLALALAAVAAFVGVLEWRTGTMRAVLTFWGVHLVALLVESFLVALPLHLSGVLVGSVLIAGRDVGPSAGYFGCLGGAIMTLKVKRPWQAVSIITTLLVLVGVVVAHLDTSAEEVRELSAAIAHVIAFALGVMSWRLGRRPGPAA